VKDLKRAGQEDTSPYDAQIRGVQSNEAKNVTLEEEAVDMRGGADRFCW
jgi:hypothetical protein